MKLKFLLPTLLSLLLLTFAFLYWLPGQLDTILTEELLARGRLITEALDKASIGGLTVYDRQALDQLAKGFFRSREILYIVIIDKDGQVMSDSGLQKQDLAGLKNFIAYVEKVEADTHYRRPWGPTAEDCLHVARPVFFEKVRVGTILLGLSARDVEGQVKKFQTWAGLMLVGALLFGLAASLVAANSISSRIRGIASGLSHLTDAELEVQAGSTGELNKLVESILTQKNLFKTSIAELEARAMQLETDLSLCKTENTTLSARLGALSKQIEELQGSLQKVQGQSHDLSYLLPVLEFASGVAPEIDRSMQQISESAGHLGEDFDRLKNLIDLYEKALPQSPEDHEVIRQYKDFIHYDAMKESLGELVSTIRGGSSWAEQLADILKRISSGQNESKKDESRPST